MKIWEPSMILPSDKSRRIKQIKNNLFDHFFYFTDGNICIKWSSGCKEIDEVSDELKTIYQTGQIRIVEDVDLSVNAIEKIVRSISPENVDKTPEVIKFPSKTLRWCYGYGAFTTWYN